MHAAFTLLLVWGSVAPQLKSSFVWETDYRQARVAGVRDNKPLAIFVGRGPDGWKSLLVDGAMTPEFRANLNRHYISVYLDQNTPNGRHMAEAFQLTARGGLVISNRGGSLMAFRHEGGLTRAELARHLARFADPSFIVSTTVNAPRPQIHQSFKPAVSLSLEEVNFQRDVLDEDGPVLVDFSAPWCGPCRTMDPVMDSLAREFKVRKVNVDRNQGLASRFQVTSLPTIMIFKGGRILRRHHGVVAEETLRSELSLLKDESK